MYFKVDGSMEKKWDAVTPAALKSLFVSGKYMSRWSRKGSAYPGTPGHVLLQLCHVYMGCERETGLCNDWKTNYTSDLQQFTNDNSDRHISGVFKFDVHGTVHRDIFLR
jgi:hypothetical protein